MRFGERDQPGGAGGIVERAIADVVARPVRIAAAEMIPMGGVDHIFLGRVLPGRMPITLRDAWRLI
jgi:hypothetical protein